MKPLVRDIILYSILWNLFSLLIWITKNIGKYEAFTVVKYTIPFLALNIAINTASMVIFVLVLHFIGLWNDVKYMLSITLFGITICLLVYLLVRFALYLVF